LVLGAEGQRFGHRIGTHEVPIVFGQKSRIDVGLAERRAETLQARFIGLLGSVLWVFVTRVM
jgi:hypothetical protein